MSQAHIIVRWIFSPLETVPSPKVEEARQIVLTAGGKEEEAQDAADCAADLFPHYELPVCRQYAKTWMAPWHHDGHALVLCAMDAVHFAAAQKDPRLIVCESQHHDGPVHDRIADHHAVHGLKRGHTLRQALKELEKLHVNFVVRE